MYKKDENFCAVNDLEKNETYRMSRSKWKQSHKKEKGNKT